MKKNSFNQISPYLAGFAMLMLATAEAMAGATGGSFIKSLSDFISTSLEGYVGIAIGTAGILYGLVQGIGRGSLGGFGTGVGLAVGSYYGPNIITALAGAAF